MLLTLMNDIVHKITTSILADKVVSPASQISDRCALNPIFFRVCCDWQKTNGANKLQDSGLDLGDNC